MLSQSTVDCEFGFRSGQTKNQNWCLLLLGQSCSFTPICFVGGFMFYLYLFTQTGVEHDFHVRCCSCRLTVRRRVVQLTTAFSGVCVARFLLFCVMFCRSLFVSLSFFFFPLYCLPFDLLPALRFIACPSIYCLSFDLLPALRFITCPSIYLFSIFNFFFKEKEQRLVGSESG